MAGPELLMRYGIESPSDAEEWDRCIACGEPAADHVEVQISPVTTSPTLPIAKGVWSRRQNTLCAVEDA